MSSRRPAGTGTGNVFFDYVAFLRAARAATRASRIRRPLSISPDPTRQNAKVRTTFSRAFTRVIRTRREKTKTMHTANHCWSVPRQGLSNGSDSSTRNRTRTTRPSQRSDLFTIPGVWHRPVLAAKRGVGCNIGPLPARRVSPHSRRTGARCRRPELVIRSSGSSAVSERRWKFYRL